MEGEGYMPEPHFFAIDRVNSRDLDIGGFTRVLTLRVEPECDRNLVQLNTTVQVHFQAVGGLPALEYAIHLRLARIDSKRLTTVTLRKNFVPPPTGTQNYNEILNLTWNDTLGRRVCREDRGDINDINDINDIDDIDDIRSSQCGRDPRRREHFYTVSIRFNPLNNTFTPIDLEARSRSLNAIVFPERRRPGLFL
jgi:hypothetical protein